MAHPRFRRIVTLASSGEVNQAGANEFTVEEHFNFISKGSAPNVDADVLMHITQNANGDVMATVDKETLNCRG